MNHCVHHVGRVSMANGDTALRDSVLHRALPCTGTVEYWSSLCKSGVVAERPFRILSKSGNPFGAYTAGWLTARSRSHFAYKWRRDLQIGSHRMKSSWLRDRRSWLDTEGPAKADWSRSKQATEEADLAEADYVDAELGEILEDRTYRRQEDGGCRHQYRLR